MKQPQAQSWKSPEYDTILKVEYVNTKYRVAGFPSGPERVNVNEMTRKGWKHLGPWVEPEKLNQPRRA